MRTLPSTPFLRAPLALLALASVIMVLRAPDERTPWWGLTGNFLDVNVYRWGGHAVLHGIPLYDGLLSGADSGRFYPEMPFTYPPFSALLFTPLDLITPRLMEAAWLAFTVGLLYLAVRMCFRALDYRPGPVNAQVSLCLALIAMSMEPVRTTLWLGQINVLLLVLVLADHLAWKSGHRWAGLGAGLAAGIKLTPAFFWVYWLVSGRWRMALASVGTFLGTVALGFAVIPRDAVQYWSGTLLDSQRIGQDSMLANQSLRGVMARVAGIDMAPTWAWLIGAAAVAAIGLGLAVLAHRAGHRLLGLTLAGLTTTMVSPFSWGHHWVWFVPLLVLAVHHALPRGDGRAGRRWYLWLLPPLLWAATANWVQSFPDVNFPDDRWVAMGLFMLGGDIPPVVYAVLTNVYPLVWMVAVGLTAVLLLRGGAATDDAPVGIRADGAQARAESAGRPDCAPGQGGTRLRDYGTTDEQVPGAEDPRRS